MGRKGKKRTHEGELTWLNVRRGYGFIKSDAWHEEIFVLVEDITLADGTKLEWTQQGSNNSAHNFQKLAIGSTLKFQLRVSQETQAHATKARVTNNGSGKSDDSSKKSNNKKKSKSRVTSIEDEQRRDSLGEDLSDSEKKRKTKKKKDENEIEVVRLNEDLDEEVIAAAAELDAQVAKQNVSSAFPKKTKTSRSRHARQITADTNDFRDDNGVYDLIDHLPEPPSNAPKRKKTKTDSLPKPKPQRSPNSTRNRKRGGGGAASVGSRIFGSFGGFMRSNPTAMATGAHNFGSSSRLSVAAANRNNSSTAGGRHRSQKSSQESLRQRFVDTDEVDMYEKPLQMLQRVLNSRANSQTRQQISVVLSAIYTLTLEAHSSLQKRVSDGRIAARRNPPDRPAECQVCFADFPSSSSLDKLPEPMLQLKRTPSDHEDANATSDARSSSRRNVNLPGDDSGTDVDDSSSSSESGSGSDSDATMSSAHSSSRSSDTMSDDESKTPAITPAAESAEPDACRAVMANCKCGDVCETCVKQYIATLTRDKDVSPWVVCPSASCKMPLSHTDLIGLIPVATLYELAGEVLRNFVARSPRWLECKKDGCNFGFLAPPVDDVEGGRTKMCQVCGTRQKVKAKQTAPDDSLKELIDQGLMRLCPQCKHPAMKDYGMCNVMKCGRCSTWWNWRNYQVGASYSDVKQKARWSGTLWEPGELSYQLNLQRSKPEEFQRLLERNGIAYDPNFVRGQN